MNLYRFQESLYTESRLMLIKHEYRIIKETPSGAWVDIFGTKKFIKLEGVKKKFACRTEEEALESYRARKKRQIKILKAQLSRAETALRLTPQDNSSWIVYEQT